MKTTTLILSAIVAALPFVANAEWTYEDVNSLLTVPENGTVFFPVNDPPYITIEPTAADETHIATTAYVKGAYNDAIAAVNWLYDEKQPTLHTSEGREVQSFIMADSTFQDKIKTKNVSNLHDKLVPASAVVTGILSQRVRIYTTWDDDTVTATTLVPFETAQ